MAVSPVPPNYPKCSPYLAVKGGAEALEFYRRAFGATERMRMPMPDGPVLRRRSGQLTDPYGHTWSIATHVEDVTPEEMQRRAANLHG